MSKFKIAKQIPFKILVKRIFKRVLPQKSINYSAKDDRSCNSCYSINSLLDASEFIADYDEELVASYLKHEFDLLGSGLVSRNLVGDIILKKEHQLFTKKALKLIPEFYKQIDWQLDVRSGFSFDVTKQFDDQLIDKTKNADIKNCWELGRLQHLPQIALSARVSNKSEILIVEFKNQVIDFITSNPIGMGVQWACAMDVGIRVSNMLVAFDIFKQTDSNNKLDEKFVSILADSIYQHGVFLWNNLEYKEGAAGNHYLFNLVGLLFISNYLSKSETTESWREFSEKEIENEFKKQFFSDGGNFEGSTTYHCLSSEAILYSTALMLRCGNQLNDDYVNLLSNSFRFIKDVAKPNREMPQFGDNDSGRLFKFYPNQDLLNYESLISGFSALFDNNEEVSFENIIVNQITKNSKLKLSQTNVENKVQLRNTNHQLQKPATTEIKFSDEIDTSKIKLFCYCEFGIYVFKSPEFYMAISAISNKKMHHSWGHVHNDKLSFDLQIKGKDFVKDPGTYTYSAFPEKREVFRNSKSHNGIVVKGIEQNKGVAPFYLEREVGCEILEIKDLSIILQAKYYGVIHTRKFTILSDQLVVTDYCNKPFKVNINKFTSYSPNYGSILEIR